jgi:hypothetical protein
MPVTEQDALRAMEAFKVLGDQPELQAKAKLIHDTYRTEQESAGKPLFPEYQRQSVEQFQKIRKGFTDPDKYGFDDDQFRDFAQTFPDPEKRARYVNNQFLSRTFQRSTEDIRNGGTSYRDQYAKETWGEAVKSDEEFRQKLAGDFQTEDAIGDYAQKAALKGLTAQEAIATLPDEIKQSDSFKRQSAKFSKSVEDTAADTEMRISPYRETINNTVEDLKATMGVDGATGEKSSFSDFANRLIEVPAEDRDLVLSAIIENGGDGEPNKKWTQKIAENFSRGSRDIVLDIPAFGSRAMLVNLKARAASGALVEGDPKTAEDYLRGLNSVATAALDSASMGTAIPSPTNAPNEKVKTDALAMIEKGLDTIDLGARIREIADNDIDPASGEYMVTRGLYAAARSIPYTVVAMMPGGMIVNSAALAEQSYQTLRRSNPGMDRDKAMMISVVAGPVMGSLEKVSAGVLTGKFPTVGRFMNQAVATTGGAAARFAVRGAEGTAIEMVQENLQDFTPYAVQGVVAGLGADVPDIPWEKVYGGKFWEQQGELFFAVLPLAMFGAGAGSISDFKGARELISNPQAVSTLIGNTAKAVEIADLGKAGKFGQAQTLLREELRTAGQDTKEIQETRITAAQNLQREAVAQKEAIEKGEELGIIPIVTPKTNVKIGEDIFDTGYMVRFNDNTERVFATYTEANEARWAHSGSRNIRFHEEVVSTISHADRTQREGHGTRYVMTGQDETLLKRVERGEVSREAALNRADTASDVDNQVFGAEKIRKLNVVNQTNEATTGMPNVSVSPLTQNSPGSPYYQASINIEGKDTAGHVSIKKLDDGTAVLSDIQIGYEGDVGRGKGHGTLAYAEIGKQLATMGITLQSTRWSKHQTSISPQSLKVWAKLEAMGLAKQTGSNESKVYDRQSGEDSVEVIPEYDFVPANTDGEVTAPETNAPLTKTSSDFKDPDSFYRVIVGDAAFQDIVDSGVVRTNARTKPPAFSGGEISLANRPTRWPSFSKGKASMSYAASNPNNYIVVSDDSSIQPSTKGKHGEGTTMFPTDQNGEAMESLDASKVDVYKHIGEGRYDLVYSKGKQVGQLTNEEIKAGIADEYDENFTASEIKALNEDDRLNSLIILGENVTEFENGLYITTAKLHNGATWATVIEEKLEGDVSVMIEKGRRDWLLKSLRSFEVLSGDRIFRADSEGQETDTDIKEAYARAGLGYFIGTEGEKGGFQASAKFRKRYQGFVTAGLSGSMEGYARFFSSVAIRADSLQQMRKKGVLDPELERELARSTGYGEQAQYEDSVFEEVAANVEAMKAGGFVATDDAPFSVIRNELGFEQGKMKIGDLPRDIKEAMFNEYAMFVNHSATEREFYKKSVPFGMIKIADLKIEEIPNSQIQPFKGVDSMPPILIADGKLIDGQHRIQSARNAGKVAIRFIDVTGLTDTSDSGAGFISYLPGYSEPSFSVLSNVDQKIAELFTPYLRDPEQKFRIVQEVQKRSVEKGREWQPILNANRTNAEIEAERKTVENDLIGQKLETLSPSELGALEAQGVLNDNGMRPILSDLLREKFYKSKSGKSVRYWTGSLMSKSAAAREGIDTKGGEWDGIPEGLPPYVWGGSITPDQAATRFGFETQEEFWTALESEIVSFQNLKEDTKQAMSRIREIEKEAKAESKVWAEEQKKIRRTVGSDRATLIGAMRTLDAMISALPMEIRGKIGGFTKLAQYTSPQAMLNELERRSKTLDRELERWLKKEADRGVKKLFDKAKPAVDQAGKKRVGKAGAEIHDLFDTARKAWKNWDSEKAEAHAVGLEAEIAKGEMSGREEAFALMEAEMVRSFGGWSEADSIRRTHALETATDLWAGGFLEYQQQKAEEKELRDKIRKELIGDTGKTGALSERNLAEEAGLKTGAKSKEFMIGLLNFDQLVSYAFGKKSKWAKWFADNQRNAENQKLDAVQEVTEGVEDLFTRLAGGNRFDGERLQFKLSRKSITAKSATGDNVRLSELEGLTVLLMWQQEDGKRHMRGRKDEDGNLSSSWSYDDNFVDEVSGQLSREAWGILGYLQSEYSQEYGPLNEVYRKLYGVNLPKNPNYSPLTMAPQQASGGQSVDPVTGTTASNGSMTPGGLRTRGAGAIAEPQFRDAVATFIAHRKQMEHWKAHAEFNRDAQAILGNRELGNSLEAKHGREAVTVLRKWLDAIAQGGVRDVAADTRFTRGLANMMGNAAGMALVGRAGTIAVQATQLGAAAAKMPAGAYAIRLGKLLSGNLEWGAALNSPYIQRRLKQQPIIVQAAMEGLRAGKPTQLKHQVRKLGNLIGGADALFTAGTFAMVQDYQYSQAIQSGASPAEAAEISLTEAERITDEVAQPTRLGARSYTEVSMTNPLAKLSWAFGSEARKNLALLAYNVATGTAAEKAQAILYVVAINGLLSGVIRNAWRDARGDDDDEVFDERYWSAKRLGLVTATDWLFGFPVVGEQIQNAIFSAFGEYQFDSSLLDPIGKAPGSVKKLVTGGSKDVLRDVENIMTAIGLFDDNTAAATSIMHMIRDLYGLGKNFTD